MCAAPRHDSDVTAGDTEDFFVAAPYLCKYGLRLAGLTGDNHKVRRATIKIPEH